MSLTPDIAETEAKASRDLRERTVAPPAERSNPSALLAEARTWASGLAERASVAIRDVCDESVALVKLHPGKAATTAAVAAIGVGLGVWATRRRA